MNVTDNPAKSRFELAVGDTTAFAAYHLQDGTVVFVHTEVPESLSGQGIGSALARGALDIARARGMGVVARCPFIAAFIRRHPEYQDLLAGES
ncbi:MAG TPA: GNAT family N-acetyltransferase [Azospirillum sp.]|nr:GNAT family N-acetyltransferase [Azospirillum sp.]